MPNSNLQKLRSLTTSLAPFPPVLMPGCESGPMLTGSDDRACTGYTEYKMKEGECFAWFIHRSGNDIAIHRWFNSKGTHFPEHTHQEKEWVIVYKGSMELTVNGINRTLKAGDSYYAEPYTIHSAYFNEDCRYITITIPSSKEFPNGIARE